MILFSPSDVCEDFECQRGHECQVFEPTGEAFCEPNCKELNPCEPNQECVITQVQCVRAPCPGVLSCEDSEFKYCSKLKPII